MMDRLWGQSFRRDTYFRLPGSTHKEEIGDEDPIAVACVSPCESMYNALADLTGKLGILEILKTADVELVVTDNKALFLSL